MEKENKQSKAKSNLLKLLPKAAQAVNFQNPPYSPSRDKRSDHHHINSKLKPHVGKGISSPVTSLMIPAEARRKFKSDQSIGNQEPTSPKVSCMGQIKHKHKKTFDKARSLSLPKENSNKHAVFSPHEVKKQAVKLKRMFTGSKPAARKSFDENEKTPSLPDRAPGLSQMKRFASGRDTFANFDWTAHQIAPEEYSDEEGNDSDQEQEVIIPFSAPTRISGVAAGMQPRKEVNLWKRRAMNPPTPLQLNSMVDSN